MGGQRLEKKPGGGKKGWAIAGGIVAAAAAAYLGLCAWVGGNDQVMPGVYFASTQQELSGHTSAQVREILTEKLTYAAGSGEAIEVRCGDFTTQLGMDLVSFDVEANVAEVMAEGRENFLANGFQFVARRFGEPSYVSPVGMTVTAEGEAALEDVMDQADQSLDTYPTAEGYLADLETGKLTLTKGYTTRRVDREAAAEQLKEAFWSVADDGVGLAELPIAEQPPVTPDFDAIHGDLYAQMVEPVYDKTTGLVSEHTVGVDFDVNVLKAEYDGAAEGSTFSIPLTVTRPRDTKESLEAKLFADLLGQGTSNVSGTANRKSNVKLAAAACNGVILMPGEEFSYNNTTGSRTADKGYLPAGVYVKGESVDEVGGGICQVSSTIYYAILHTTLEITERHDHLYAVGYVPDGMDATVYYGSMDFRFKNSTNYPLKVVTESYDKGGVRKLTVKIYGTNEDGRYAVPERTQYDWEEPTTAYKADETVARGTLVLDTKQNAYTGRKAMTYRYIYEADGTLVERQNLGESTYKMRPHLYHYNPLDGEPATWVDGKPPVPGAEVTPAPAPAPAPTPAPETTTPDATAPAAPAPEQPAAPAEPEGEVDRPI